jgi:hypothetical protein
LHDDPAARAGGGDPQRGAEQGAQQPRRKGAAGKAGTQPHDPIDRDGSVAAKGQPPGKAAEQNRFQGEMIDDVGPLRPIKPGDLAQAAHRPEEAVAAPPPAEWMQGKSLATDPLAMRLHPGSNGYVAAGLAQGAGEGQPVGPEIPILSREKEQLRPLCSNWRRQCRVWRRTGQQHANDR